MLTDIVIGDPRRPDLTGERGEVVVRQPFGFPEIRQDPREPAQREERLTKVETKTSQKSMKPTWAPRVVAVSSSPEPTTAALVIIPGPRKRRLPLRPVGGSWISSGSSV